MDCGLNDAQTNQKLLRGLDCFDEGLILLDMGVPDWRILYANECWSDVTGEGALIPHTQAGDRAPTNAACDHQDAVLPH